METESGCQEVVWMVIGTIGGCNIICRWMETRLVGQGVGLMEIGTGCQVVDKIGRQWEMEKVE